MRYLWLFWFPLLFLPNLGFSQATAFGVLEFSDFLIGPYLALLVLGVTWGDRLNVGRLTPWMGIFIAWAILSTVTISLRYGYADDFQRNFGLLKVAKMGLYGVAGILTARALARPQTHAAFDWALLAASVVCGVSLWTTQLAPVDSARPQEGYSATNGISVMAALLLIYIGAKLVTGHGSPRWRLVAPLGLIVTMAGSAVSDGRGGWVAAIAGAVYLLVRLGPTRQLITYGLAAVLVVGFLYQSQPEFKRQVDVTLFMDPEVYGGYEGTRNVGTIDDGARFQTWDHEIRKLDNAPILGAGIFNRTGASTLWWTGSHNYWLQMLLEAGIVGGTLVLAIVARMWRQATRLRDVVGSRADIPLKAALVTAFVGGLGGEYFYGGIILFTLLAVYAQTGGMPLPTLAAAPRRSLATETPAAMPYGAVAD